MTSADSDKLERLLDELVDAEYNDEDVAAARAEILALVGADVVDPVTKALREEFAKHPAGCACALCCFVADRLPSLVAG